jgi:hypothetical protein
VKPVLLTIHVLAAILFVGPIAVSTSLFPRYAWVAGEAAQLLHRVTRVYTGLAVTVPVAGLALAVVQGRATEVWIIVSLVLTALAGGILALQILPRQRYALAHSDAGAQMRSLTALAGVVNLLWAAVVVLMIVRPGSRYA